MKWHSNNKAHFVNKGYNFTKMGDSFNVFVEDLFSSSRCKIKMQCDYCNNVYETTYATYVLGRKKSNKDACKNCAPLKATEINKERHKKIKFKRAREICETKNYTLLTKEEEYTSANMIIYYDCPKHGVRKSFLDNFIRGHGCFLCARESIVANLRNEIIEVKNFIESINNNKLLNPEEYKNASERNLKIKCGLCGEIFITSYSNYKLHGVTKCRHCSKKASSGESIVASFLNKNKINFEREKRFDDCRDKKPLPFDFYLTNYNVCIEYDGIQHYEPAFTDGSFEMTKRHDKIKNEYCKNNNIELIRIPYYEKENIYNILTDKLLNKVS